MGHAVDELVDDEPNDTIQASDEIRLFRIVQFDPPSLSDFMSRHELGLESPNLTPEQRRLVRGISCFATLVHARKKARRFPSLGSFVVTLLIPPQRGIHIERTTSSPGHHTI